MRTIRVVVAVAALLGASLTALVAAPPAAATTIDVANETQYRQALVDLSADPNGPHTINVTDDIVLADSANPVYSGDQDLTVNGNGNTISGGGNSRILDSQNADAHITLSDLTLTGGEAPAATNGGAILAVGDVSVSASTLNGNTAGTGTGGAIRSRGDVSVSGSTLSDNTAGSLGGAIDSNEDVSVSGSTLSGNTADESSGGAILSTFGGVSVSGSTLNDNTAGSLGGAIRARGDAALTNATVTGNQAVEEGGGVSTDASLTLLHATVVENQAPEGANVAADTLVSFGSVVARPVGGPNCTVDNVDSQGHNLSDDNSCGFTDATDTVAGDPGLGALADNGGPTLTMLPQPGSPLIDAIPEADCDEDVTTDQRGIPRPQDGLGNGVAACDIGAVEVALDEDEVPPPAAPVPAAPVPAPVPAAVVVAPPFTG